MVRFIVALLVILVGGGVGFLAFSHRILAPESDDCQQDITHMGHIQDLAAFHCIGHSEGNADEGWDHIHSWMAEEWHAENSLPQTSGVALSEENDLSQ